MKYIIKTTKRFDKDLKRCEKRGLNMHHIQEAMLTNKRDSPCCDKENDYEKEYLMDEHCGPGDSRAEQLQQQR